MHDLHGSLAGGEDGAYGMGLDCHPNWPWCRIRGNDKHVNPQAIPQAAMTDIDAQEATDRDAHAKFIASQDRDNVRREVRIMERVHKHEPEFIEDMKERIKKFWIQLHPRVSPAAGGADNGGSAGRSTSFPKKPNGDRAD